MNNVYIGAKGYFLIKKQTDKNTAIKPDFAIPYISEDITTKMAKHQEKSVKGNRSAVQRVVNSGRSHGGTVSVPAYTNITAHILNMMLTRGSVSGSGPYTIPFTAGDTEQYYTLDIKKGNFVHRFIGVKGHSLAMAQDEGAIRWDVELAGLKAFHVARAAGTPSGSGPYTVTLKTDYDPAPTTGLTTADTLIWENSSGVQTDVTIASVPNGTTFTTIVDVSLAAANDKFYLKAQTPTFSLGDLLLWGRTEFRFGADASAALSATHTPGDAGSVFKIIVNNETNEGAMQSGSYDPTDFRRTTVDVDFTFEAVYDQQDDLQRYLDNEKRACVIRLFTDTSSHEFRLTLNDIKGTDQPLASAGDGVTKVNTVFKPAYDVTDTQSMDVKVICGLSTV